MRRSLQIFLKSPQEKERISKEIRGKYVILFTMGLAICCYFVIMNYNFIKEV